jgi:hypothetical protein
MLDANIKIITELKNFIALVISNNELIDKFSVAPEHFIRSRKLPFDKLVFFILKLCKKTLSIELEQFFENIGNQTCCSVSAFVQQRLKLEPFFFYYWNKVLLESFSHYYGKAAQKWKGYRIIAADGSNISLINNTALNRYFGGQSNQQSSYTQAKTFYHYDVLNELVLLARIEAYRYGEMQMAYDSVGNIEDDMIMIYDRYYSNYKMVALHMWQEKERKFVIRGNERQNLIKSFINSGKRSAIAFMTPSTPSVAGLRECGFVVTSKSLLKVRLVRVDLDHSVEVLITNLWEEDGFGHELFKDLYFMRWGIETNISIQKNILQLEAFSGLTVRSVLQDFYATIMVTNLHSILIKEAQQTVDNTTKHHKHPKKINKNKSLGKLKVNLVYLFLSDDVNVILQKLHTHFVRDVIPIRKGRSFKRVRKNPQSKSKYRTFSNFKPAY